MANHLQVCGSGVSIIIRKQTYEEREERQSLCVRSRPSRSFENAVTTTACPHGCRFNSLSSWLPQAKVLARHARICFTESVSLSQVASKACEVQATADEDDVEQLNNSRKLFLPADGIWHNSTNSASRIREGTLTASLHLHVIHFHQYSCLRVYDHGM